MSIYRIRSAFFLCAACAFFAFIAPGAAAAADTPQTRYLRAVHVLRTLDPSLDTGSLAIPRRIMTDDTTNALARHPDKTFVLDTLARDLETLARDRNMRDADYYAAHAYALLGRRDKAASAMARYVVIAPYREENYLFLVRCLYEAARYEAMRDAVRDWSARDPSCGERRLAYLWGSHLAEGRPLEALKALEADRCNTWQTQILAARSTLDLGDAEAAERMVAAAVLRHHQEAQAVLAFWERIRGAERYP